MKLLPLVSLLAPLAACDDEPSNDEAPAEPTLVTIQTGEPPALIAFRDQASTNWQVLPVAGASRFQVDVRGRYEIVVVCENVGTPFSVETYQYARTPADEALIRLRCNRNTNASAAIGRFVVHGTMVQPGLVVLGTDSTDGFQPNWQFELPASAGSFDHLMFSEGPSGHYDHLAIRRDLAIIGDTDLGSIDLVQEGGQPLIRTPITAANLEPGETLGSMVMLETNSTGIGLGQSGENMLLAPAGLLRTTDKQWAEISAHQGSSGATTRSRTRTVVRDVRAGEDAAVAFPAPLGPVTFEMTADRLTASWSEVPEHDQLWLSHSSFRIDHDVHYELSISSAFVDATGTTSAVLDFHDVPGFKSTWRHDPADAWQVVFESGRFASNSWRVSEWNGPTSVRRAPRGRAQIAITR